MGDALRQAIFDLRVRALSQLCEKANISFDQERLRQLVSTRPDQEVILKLKRSHDRNIRFHRWLEWLSKK